MHGLLPDPTPGIRPRRRWPWEMRGGGSGELKVAVLQQLDWASSLPTIAAQDSFYDAIVAAEEGMRRHPLGRWVCTLRAGPLAVPAPSAMHAALGGGG